MERADLDVGGLVRPEWGPLRHVRRGWAELTGEEQADVRDRVGRVLAQHEWGDHSRDALLHFFTFLAQVETIAIEIPLRFLPHARPEVRPLLRRQLVDEVFHSTIFSRLAHELALPNAQPPAPLASAEALLERIRHEPDLAITATLLNLVAEGWIETLFRHALKWGVAPAVFKAVLAEEARHVDEARLYMQDLDKATAQAAVHSFEQGMARVSAEPTVALAILDLAGEPAQQALAEELFRQHVKHLAEAGLTPSPQWREMGRLAEKAVMDLKPLPAPQAVEDTHWRRLARQVWQTPRDPTMQGDFDVAVGHIPRKALTPVLIAALGRTLAAHPELNRVVVRDRLWQLPFANVGVRVLLEDNELATVVIPQADKRSVRDIRRMLADGIQQLRDNRAHTPRPAAFDPTVASLTPALPHMFAMAISNAGKWGVVSGAGSFSGWVSPSTDITVGLRRRLPTWRGVAYLPAWHVNIAAIQDHRVLDGRGSATTVTGLQAALSREGVRRILAAPDTLPSEDEVQEALAMQAPAAAAAQAQFAALGLLGLPKYTPVVLGGLGLGALFGVGGYLLYQNLQAIPPAIPPPPKGGPGPAGRKPPPPAPPPSGKPGAASAPQGKPASPKKGARKP